VVVRETNDIDVFYDLMRITGERDEFGVHRKEYYQRVLELFQPRGNVALFFAEHEAQPLAGLIVLSNGKRSWYFYGASSNRKRQLMPTYILQWKAMQWAKAQGCVQYDLWGVPDESHDVLEANFINRSDNLWGVYRFKRGFGGELRRSFSSWDRVYNPFLYHLYSWRVRSQ
jgi:lipid II:glycine glycyltransferase (peptidoglycan interpeptide bridge formation enzyme)